MMNLEEIRPLLSGELTTKPNPDGTKLASVLVVIYGDEPKVIMTKKSEILTIHAGEISFPGGKWEKQDGDLLTTALRETKEEINLEITPKQIIGQLQPVRTLNSGFTITPFVAVVDNVPKLKDNFEVESILRIPLEPFLKTLEDDQNPKHRSIQEMYIFKFNEHVVWGASARILKQITDIFKKNNLI
ncbi:MAG TPA: CoA pyrophosphatase [Nitrosopumilaceae archaeon]|nr:CoA pyrophosphatase [Nitrosopumilaceae archaeon]